MERIKKGLGNLGVVLALAAGLAAWAVLPWYAILAIAVGLALWLALTHQGRLAIAASLGGQSRVRWVIRFSHEYRSLSARTRCCLLYTSDAADE